MMGTSLMSVLVLTLVLTLASALPTSELSKSKWPLVVAHRGSSGTRPEHTMSAYRKAASEDGADVVECDVVLSRDLVPICSHEPWISEVSNVARDDVGPPHEDFSDRRRLLDVSALDEPEMLVNDFFTFDFDLHELRSLRRRQVRESRDKSFDWQQSFVTLQEYLQLASELNFAIYPELKHSHLINSVLRDRKLNTTFEKIVLDKLAEFGYDHFSSPCFLQTFEIEAIQDVLAMGSELKLIYLIYRAESLTDDLIDRYEELGIHGLGLPKQLIVYTDEDNRIEHVDQKLIDTIHNHHMKVHVYTFRNEWETMPFDFGHDPYVEYEYYTKLGVDGFFTDFPATMRRFVDNLKSDRVNNNANNNRFVPSLSVVLSICFTWLCL